MTYRAKHVSQKDGSALQWQNCRMAVAATHLDFRTNGAKLSTGAEMRKRQSDQSGGTDAYDAQRAWLTYAEPLVIRNGKYWADLLADRAAGRFVTLDVWYAEMPERCQTNGAIAHTVGIAPETNAAGEWLVSDPLCGAYRWLRPSDLRRAAEAWGTRMGIGKAINYTTATLEGSNMETINTGGAVSSTKIAQAKKGKPWFYNDECTDKAADLTADANLPYVGATKRGTRAVILHTGRPYEDKVARDTVAYMKPDDIVLVDAPTPPDCPECPDCPDASEVIAARDAVWVAHLTPDF